MSSAKWRPFCLSLNVLNEIHLKVSPVSCEPFGFSPNMFMVSARSFQFSHLDILIPIHVLLHLNDIESVTILTPNFPMLYNGAKPSWFIAQDM